MAEQNNSLAKKKSTSGNGSVPLTDILYRTLHYWPWLLLSLFVCVGIGVIYVLRTPKVYSTSASLLVKDDKSGKTMGGDDFADLGLFQNKTNIQNEISTLRSPDLMVEVVKRLNLDMNYYLPDRFHKVVAYGRNLPFTVNLPEVTDSESASFELNVDKGGQVAISDLKVGENEYNESYRGILNDSIKTPAGPIVVIPAAAYLKGDDVEMNVVKTPVYATATAYESKLSVAMSDDKGTVLNLSLLDQSSQRAQDVLNTLIGVYNESWIRDKNQVAVATSNFINDRLNVIESDLGNVDSDISSYKSEHLIPDLGAASSMYMAQSQKNSQDMLALSNQLQMTRYIRSYLASSKDYELLPSNTGISNGDINSQIAEYNQMVLNRNSLIEKSSDKNPLVITLNDNLASLKSAIIKTVDNSIVVLQNELGNIQKSQASTTSKIASNPTQAKYLLSVERQQKVKESLYLFLLQKREENELSQAFSAYNTRIIQKPNTSGTPASPNTRNILSISFLLGLSIPFVVVYLMETGNTKIRGRKDVENLALPFLGEIPLYAKGKGAGGDTKSLVVKEGKRDIINEAFRVLRTNVQFMCSQTEGANTIAFTSFNPGSGKSFIAVNLAKAIALKGKKVLVIDGDMRHGSASAYVGSPETGLSNYLSGAVTDVNSVIVRDGSCDTLFVLPVGAIPPNPTELLESPRFGTMLEALKSGYDYIIIDCPPIEVVADAQIIDRFADRTIFIVRAGLLERSMLPELDRLYAEKKYRNMAFILNGTRNDQGRYGYSHSYRYGYGYGYGYGYNYGTDKK